jgi:hypothetical protein
MCITVCLPRWCAGEIRMLFLLCLCSQVTTYPEGSQAHFSKFPFADKCGEPKLNSSAKLLCLCCLSLADGWLLPQEQIVAVGSSSGNLCSCGWLSSVWSAPASGIVGKSVCQKQCAKVSRRHGMANRCSPRNNPEEWHLSPSPPCTSGIPSGNMTGGNTVKGQDKGTCSQTSTCKGHLPQAVVTNVVSQV